MIRTQKLALVPLIAFLGCGGGSGSPAPVSVSQMVTQADGGQVKVGSSGASLNIPGGSLSGDTTITADTSAPAASLPDNATLKGQYYDFGPDGTTFDPPAMLTLPAGGTPPADAKVVISWYDDANAKWVDLETTVADGKVTAPVAHFTGFVVRWIVSGVGGSTVDCSAPKGPCGGTLVGDWKPAGACVAGSAPKGCDASSTVTYDVKLMGDADFKADMTYSVSLPYSVTGTLHASASCVSTAGFTTCADAQAKLRTSEDEHFPTLWANATCTGTAAAGCDCTASTTGSITESATETGTYTTTATTFTTTKAGSADPGDANGYCVDGDTIWVQTKLDPPEYLVFKK